MEFTGIASPKDVRDFPLGKIQQPVAIPEVFMPDYSHLPTYHQNKQPSCIGHAVTWMINFNENKEGIGKELLSPRFVYALAKSHDGIPDVDGTYYRQGLKEAKDFGVCKDDLFANNTNLSRADYNDVSKIGATAYEDADYRRIKAYASVDNLTFEGLKQAIYQNKVVMLAMRVGNTMYTDQSGNTTWQENKIMPLRVPTAFEGGHAVVAIGYDKDYIYFKNSWGTTWAKGGIGYFGKDYVQHVYEAWTMVDLSNEEIKRLKAELVQKIGLLTTLVQLWTKLRQYLPLKRK